MLDKTRLKNNLKAAFIDADTNGGNDRTAQLDYICDKLAGVLIDEVKQLVIVYTNGLIAPNGAVTGAINHTVS